ncbi:MAG TPA: alpha/beta fold hydrolase [Gemmataceae bacterium]|jgi:haloalkane dehalogenase|nr:alpha/beta fold hydrolase [Gemmataceae bacterium]
MAASTVEPSLYPFASHFLDLDGLKLHYVDEGQGQPILMLHGNPTWSFYFRNLVLALRDQYRVIVPDHMGCGLSDKPTAEQYDFSLETRINDLERLLDRLNIPEDITLVLHDWGGMIGMAYASRHPERIRRFIVMNTAAFHLPKAKRFPWALWLGRNTRLGAWLILQHNAFCRAAVRIGTKRRALLGAVRQAYLAPYDSPEHRLAVLRFVQTIPLHPADVGYEIVSEVERSLHQFSDRPMLINWGMRDFVFDWHFLAEWERRFPEAEVVRFADAGHYVLEDATEEMIENIKRFLFAHDDG